ncbi:hypothetical protein TrCOL_g2378 [Triparma columacea]|uniref:Uncharacterized protein n=1 Tax=Triparma columacea TaxID=722753 RepID=A0A9W7GFX2_9STRA|nr:hypothetical protein TrCOL_g2378 [Triparma columacea]
MSALAASPATPTSLRVLLLSCSLSAAQLTTVLTNLKESSKKSGSHKTRQLLWKAYGDMIGWAGGKDGNMDCFLMFKTGDDVDSGVLEVVELTKRQRGCCGSLDMLGKKHKPTGEEEKCNGWAMAWSEDEADEAWRDLMEGEPCVYCTGDKVYVGTKYKRVMCKGVNVKTGADVESLLPTLLPDNPLRSVSFTGNSPPSINNYNFIMAGSWAFKFAELGSTWQNSNTNVKLTHLVNSTSTDAIYDYFLTCKGHFLIGEAEKLISQMLTDVEKGLTPCIYAASMKEAGVARRNALMKKVYVHSSKTKFIQGAREDGGIEVNVIEGDIGGTKFNDYGGIVFEIHYRTELGIFG